MSILDKIDPVIRRDTKYIAAVVIILTVLMEAVFLVIGKWDVTVLFGGLLGAFAAMLNFILMALGVQKSLSRDAAEAKGAMKVSHSMRMLMLVVICAVAALLPGVFNLVSVLVPLVFPSVGARLHSVILKDKA